MVFQQTKTGWNLDVPIFLVSERCSQEVGTMIYCAEGFDGHFLREITERFYGNHFLFEIFL